MKDSDLILREANVLNNGNPSNKKVDIRVEASLPMFITDETKLQELILSSESSPADGANKYGISDVEYKASLNDERYVYLTTAKSPITYNIAVFFYDKLCEDILIVPDVSAMLQYEAGFRLELRGYRLGAGVALDKTSPFQVLPVNVKSSFKLPLIKGAITCKTHIVMIPGVSQENLIRTNLIDRVIDNRHTINISTVQPMTIVELGTSADLFNGTPRVPLYLLGQTSIKQYQLHYINNTEPGNNKIFIGLNF